jgi:glycerophosphoryl diester phosphodiesterase
VVQISAHRGGCEAAEPSTYEAYRDALSTGAEYAEFDIRKTADNVLVVYHDSHAEGTGALVADLGYRELCGKLNYEVARVDKVMAMMAGRMTGHLDLKEVGYEDEVITLARSVLGAGNFVATTLEDVSVAAIKQVFPDVTTALSLGRDLDGVPRRQWASVRRSELFPVPRLEACRADWAAVNYKLGRLGATNRCKRHGHGVMLWTVDSDELIDRCLTGGEIEVLVTNRPRHAVKRRAELTG